MRLLYILFFFSFYISFSQSPLISMDESSQKKWVDSVYQSLSQEEKIGQLFTVWVATKYGKEEIDHISNLIKKYKLGGLIFSLGNIKDQADATNHFQGIANVPLLIGMDAEWGIGMRLDDAFSFPYNMTLGAVEDNELIYKVGERIGKHANRLGVHINFAPVVDINTNPDNPIIGSRSFGEDKYNVADKALFYMKGMQSKNLLGSAKHFPGHGDTKTDSHYTLPLISFSEERIDSIELYPFKKLIDNNIASIMTAHLNIPSLQEGNLPSTLSKKILTNLLKDDLGFQGLIVTDALDMKGVVDFSKKEYADVSAMNAGNDILLMPNDLDESVKQIKKALSRKKISNERLEESVKKILMAKYKVGLHEFKPIVKTNIVEEMNEEVDYALLDKIASESITIVKNENQILPFRNVSDEKIGYLKLGDDSNDSFLNFLNKYHTIEEVQIDENFNYEKLSNYDKIIIGFHKTDKSPFEKFRFEKQEVDLIENIKKLTDLVLVIFAKPYSVSDLNIDHIESIVIGYQNSEVFQQKAAQVIFGAIPAKGKLPVSIHKNIPVNTQIKTKKLNTVGFSHYLNKGFDEKKLNKVDSLINYAIKKQMLPGAQLVAMKDGHIVYNKSFGYFTYQKKKKVNSKTLFDLASLTKILVSVPLMIKEFDSNNLNLSSTLSDILYDENLGNKSNLRFDEMFSHQSALIPWIPFYEETLDSLKINQIDKFYSTFKTNKFSTRVSENLYMNNYWNDTIFKRLIDSDLLDVKEYKYSDVPYYFIKKYFEKKYNSSLDDIIKEEVFNKIGAFSLTYNPRLNYQISQIAPSEEDDYFRFSKLQGFVHDMGASMQGGVGGHAGLFGTAEDVSKVMQLFLNKGTYANNKIFSSVSFDLFNKRHFNQNRRGIGFDKPQLDENILSTCGCVSDESFGHSGFTGTYAWADPEDNLVYVFLSNRTYPTMRNNMISEYNIRTEVHRLIKEASE